MNTQLEGMTYVKCLEKLLRKTSWRSRIKLFFKENASAASDMLSNHGLARHIEGATVSHQMLLCFLKASFFLHLLRGNIYIYILNTFRAFFSAHVKKHRRGGGGVILAEKVLVVTMRTGAETPAAVGGCVLYGWTIVNYGEHSTAAFI